MNLIDGVLSAFINADSGGLRAMYKELEEMGDVKQDVIARKALEHFRAFWDEYFKVHPIEKYGVDGTGDLTVNLHGNITLVLKEGQAESTAHPAQQLFPYRLTLAQQQVRQV